MPINENNSVIPLFVHGERKENSESVFPLGKSIESNIIGNDMPNGFLEIIKKANEAFVISMRGILADGFILTKADLFIGFVYGYDFRKLTQNNFRKLHGFPMKRRKWL